MVIVCRGCGARFRMAHALFQDAKGARIRCRKCGVHIDVRLPEASPPPPAPEVPSAFRYEPAPTTFPELLEDVPKEGHVTAPVFPTQNLLSHAPSSDAPVPPAKPKPEKEAPMPEEADFSISVPVTDTNPFSSGDNSYDAGPHLAGVPVGNSPIIEPGDTVPAEESKHAQHAPWMETVPPREAPDAAPTINCSRDGLNKKIYTVYRIGYWNNKLELIGKMVERRKAERNNNAADMLRWAQNIYASSSIDSNIFIVNEGSSGGPIFGGE